MTSNLVEYDSLSLLQNYDKSLSLITLPFDDNKSLVSAKLLFTCRGRISKTAMTVDY